MKAQADIAPIEFGSLDEALGAIHGIRKNADEQEGRLEQVQIAVHGWLGQGDVARKLGLIDELADAEGCRTHEPAEIRQRRNGRERLEVALQIGSHVAVEPHGPL